MTRDNRIDTQKTSPSSEGALTRDVRPLVDSGMPQTPETVDSQPFRRSAENYRELLLSANDAVFVADAVSGIIVEANVAASELTGRSIEKLIGMHQVDLHPPDRAEEYGAIFRDYVGQARGITPELLVRHASGHDIPVEISSNILELDGRTYLKGIFRDLRSRTRAKQLSDNLNEINQIINSTLDIDELVEKVVSTSSAAVEADSTALVLLRGEDWTLTYLSGPSKYEVGAVIPFRDMMAGQLALDTRASVAIADAQNDPRCRSDIARKIGMKSFLVVPLLMGERPLGLMVFRYLSQRRDFTTEEIGFANKLGSSISLAIENARLYAEQPDIANTLQKALLIVPEKLSGLDFGYIYRSAAKSAIVGGDFYDLFTLDRDRIGVVIGDVSGKGLEAATLTSSLKHMMKAYAYEGHSPAAIIEKTNVMAIKETGSSMFVTAFVGLIGTRSGILTYCCAGHPPPIIKRRGGGVELLETSCPALGALDRLETGQSWELMHPGDVLTLYTDGVTEARGETDMFGESRLLDFIAQTDFPSAGDLPQMILDQLSQRCRYALADDLAIVSLALHGQDAMADRADHVGFSDRLSAAGTLSDIGEILTQELIGQLGVSGASFLLFDSEKGRLNGHLGWPEAIFPNIAKVVIHSDDVGSAAARAVRTRAPVAVEDAINSPETKKWLVRAYGVRALIALPIIIEPDPLGCVVAIDKERVREFSAVEIIQAQKLVDAAAGAIQALYISS